VTDRHRDRHRWIARSTINQQSDRLS